MKRVLAGLAVLLLAAGMALAHCGMCDGDAKTVTGDVVVTKSDAGEVTAVKVGDLAVALDDNGKKLVDMAGKKVEVAGKMKDHKLVVETVKPVEAPAAPAK